MTDSDLLELFRKHGDREALGHLFLRYLELVYGVSLKYLAQPEAAQDAVMDIYEHLQRKLPGQEVGHFAAWLYRVTANHCLQELRKQKKTRILPLEDSIVQSEQILHQDVGFTDLDTPPDEADRLHDCLAGLPEGQQRCIRMFYFEKQSYAAISLQTGMPLDTVRSHIQNGRRNLKRCMESPSRHDR